MPGVWTRFAIHTLDSANVIFVKRIVYIIFSFNLPVRVVYTTWPGKAVFTHLSLTRGYGAFSGYRRKWIDKEVAELILIITKQQSHRHCVELNYTGCWKTITELRHEMLSLARTLGLWLFPHIQKDGESNYYLSQGDNQLLVCTVDCIMRSFIICAVPKYT
jgi:hypothetical protein